MSERLQSRWLYLGLALLGGLCAWPLFLFVGPGGIKISLAPVPWRECWLGLPSWSGIPVPVVLPILLAGLVAGAIRLIQREPSLPLRSPLIAGAALAFAVLLVGVADASRGIQLLVTLALLAAVPRLLTAPAVRPLLRGWLIGGLLFVGLQLFSVWLAAGSPLLLAQAAWVPGAAGDWGVGEATRIWGLCIYQALISVPDLSLALATLSGLKAVSMGCTSLRVALVWGFGWLAALAAAFNSGRSSVLLVLVLQLLIAVWLMRSGRSRRVALVPALPLGILWLFSAAPFKPVVLDRLLAKAQAHELLDRLPIWRSASRALSHQSETLLLGSSLDTPGTHSLIGDLIFRIGLPLTALYLAAVLLLCRKALCHALPTSSPNAKAGLWLLLAVPVVQNLLNVNLLLPFSLFNDVLAALAIVRFL